MLRRFTAILLALLVLVSSTGYSITAHLCHGKAVSYSLFGRPADCGEGEETTGAEHCDHPEPVSSGRENCQSQDCCTTDNRFIKGIETTVHIGGGCSWESLLYIAPEAITKPPFISGEIAAVFKTPINFAHPPERVRDWPVWLCVFRI